MRPAVEDVEAMAVTVALGGLGVGTALFRGVTGYRQTGSITWGWLVVGLIFLAIALTPIV